MPDLAMEELADALFDRESRRRNSCAVVVLVAVGYLPSLSWVICLSWLATFLALQAGQSALIHATRKHPSSSWALALRLGSIAAQSLALGSLGAFVMQRGTPLGPAIGVAHLLTCMFLETIASRRSVLAFWARLAPLVFLMLGAWAVLLGRPGDATTGELATLAWCNVVGFGGAVVLRQGQVALGRAETAAREAALAANAAKSTFIATVSHELRTPLSAIQAGAQELERTSTEAGQRRRAALVLDAARMMRNLLNDLLDLSKVEAGRMGVECVPFDARRLVTDTLRLWQAEARAKGLRLTVRGGRHLPRWLVGDPTRLRQILNNLLSNALKFTEHGAVQLVAAVEGASLNFAVVDQGTGMSAAQMSRLFSPFSQADESVARTHGGTGLGLALSRDLARLMGGDLVATSAPGEGSRFTLSLPLVLAQPALEKEDAAPETDTMPPLRVLVVDDHEINRRAMGLLLEPVGLHPSFATDGAEALQTLLHEPYDLVLMDVHLPHIDGLEVTRRIRAGTGPNRHTPILAVTGATSSAERARCLEAGMTHCVGKPIEAAELYAAIGEAIESNNAEPGAGAVRL